MLDYVCSERKARRQTEKRKRGGKRARQDQDSSDDELYSTGDEKPTSKPKQSPDSNGYADLGEEESPPPLKRPRGRRKSSGRGRPKSKVNPKVVPRKKKAVRGRVKRGRPTKVVEEDVVEAPFDPRALQEGNLHG